MPYISIVIPIYNVDQFIGDCINSVLGQTYKDFELILVNDGSTDRSLEICHQYADVDPRIVVIDKPNSGVGSTRNIGIDASRGQWITFIDSDDRVASDYLESMARAISDNTDFVQSGIIFFDNDSGNEIGCEVLPEKQTLHRNIPVECFEMAIMPLITSPVSKLYRRDILNVNGIRFDTTLSVGEDRDFNLAYINVINRACMIAYAGYYYRKGISGNLSSNRDYIQLLNWDIDYWKKLKRFFDVNDCDIDTTEKYLAHRLFNIYNDRLVQYSNAAKRPMRQLIEAVKTIVGQSEYTWLCKHIKQVECNRLLANIYLSKSPILIAVYLKVVCQKNG